METRLKQTLLDITEKLRKRHHRFAVVGGVATTILGYLRVTQDVDLVVDLDDIIVMKLMASRDKDLGDINGLIAVHNLDLDWDYCFSTARQLDEALATDLVETLKRIRAAASS